MQTDRHAPPDTQMHREHMTHKNLLGLISPEKYVPGRKANGRRGSARAWLNVYLGPLMLAPHPAYLHAATEALLHFTLLPRNAANTQVPHFESVQLTADVDCHLEDR